MGLKHVKIMFSFIMRYSVRQKITLFLLIFAITNFRGFAIEKRKLRNSIPAKKRTWKPT